MRFDDDYLWDGTGEADPDVERLEGLLGRYRTTRPAPELPAAAPVAPVVELSWWMRRRVVIVAAAAAVIILALALAVTVNVRDVPKQPIADKTPVAPQPTAPPLEETAPAPPEVASTKDTPAPRPPRRRPAPRAVEAPVEIETVSDEARFSEVRGYRVDPLTARHVEETELLLRAVRNADVREGDDLDLAYDAFRARELLNRNKLLRRAAETRGNVPAERLLGDVEPYLLDIANLDTNPSSDDVRSIQERIERKEIVTDLRLYAMQSPARGY
jgi:hypothetical protein